MQVEPSPTPKTRFNFKTWFHKHHLAITLIVGAIVVAAAFNVAMLTIHHNTSDVKYDIKAKPKVYYSPLHGVKVADEAATTAAVTGVMIENSPEARPQSGLKNAGVVYEAVAEGGITRFLALYQGDKPELIGPVRSLRMYYLGWAAPYEASIAHVGGSPNALAEVRNGQYRDADQSFNAGYYWRTNDRYAPHNMYTSGTKLNELNASKQYMTSQFTSFPRIDAKPAETPSATSITVNFSSALFSTTYAYDKTSNSYHRSLAGAPHSDREGGQITPAVVVVLETTTEPRPGGYEDLKTTGSGKAHIFQNGTVVEATWRKDGMKSPLQLLDAEGNPTKLVRGQTWIATITGAGSVSWQ